MSEYMMGPYELAAYRSGATIREIARRGQDTLTRIWLAGKHQERLKYAEKALKQVAHCYDMSPPQTLGELCLELHEQMWRNARCITPFWMFYDYGIATEDSASLRRAMWHHNISPLNPNIQPRKTKNRR